LSVSGTREVLLCTVISEASEEKFTAFNFFEMKLYTHAMTHKWVVDKLISTINLIKSTDFRVEDVNVDLYKRVAAAIAKGHFICHSMLEQSGWRPGPKVWVCNLEEVLLELLFDPRKAGHQHLNFEMIVDKDGKHEFCASDSAVSFQMA
jgi:hypothetical protein